MFALKIPARRGVATARVERSNAVVTIFACLFAVLVYMSTFASLVVV